nr:MAG TPA: hypothetical protein [Caudoviricetes sp.]
MQLSMILKMALEDQKRTNNEYINFSDMIWTQDIEDLIPQLEAIDCNKFTISCCSSLLLANLVEFKRFGFKVIDSVIINDSYIDITTGELAKIPAVLLSKKD